MSNSYYPIDQDDVEQQHQRLVEGPHPHDGRTPLDKTIDRIGMGSYQWALLSLCGFGWMADNMWIQAIAIILPRVQQHFDIPDSYIGSLSSSMFGGMMLGAIGWGTCSDLLGRSAAFNATLFFTAVFGFFASWADSFITLCIALFLLGSAVGGSMPTDGTLLLEHMPKEKQYLVTALSVFFSFGSVLSAIVALLILPGHSCPTTSSSTNASISTVISNSVTHLLAECDLETQNQGWKYLLMTLAVITLSMFLGRIVFFRLHESPRYLVHAGRPQDAVKSLREISKFNGSDLEIELEDVRDYLHHHECPTFSPTLSSRSSSEADAASIISVSGPTQTGKADERTVFDAGDIDGGSGSGQNSPSKPSNSSSESSIRVPLITQYAATGSTPTSVLEGHSFRTPIDEYPPPILPPLSLTPAPTSPTPLASSSTTTKTTEADANVDTERRSRPTTIADRRTSVNSSTIIDHLDDQDGPIHVRRFSQTRRHQRSVSLGGLSTRSSTYVEYENQYQAKKRLFGLGVWGLVNKSKRLIPKLVRRKLAAWIGRPIDVWWSRVRMVLEPDWFRTTILIWSIWFSMSLAFTMFNVFLPKLLELGTGKVENDIIIQQQKSLEQNLWDVVIFTVGGTPGAILGAWLIESSLGRRWSLASSTLVTALFSMIFIMVESEWAVRMSTVGISLSATAMWAVLYGWTPEIFGTKVRGTACGIASALSRIGGMIAPLLGGALLTISRSIPVYTSVGVFIFSGFCVLLLREGEGNSVDRTKVKKELGESRVVMH